MKQGVLAVAIGVLMLGSIQTSWGSIDDGSLITLSRTSNHNNGTDDNTYDGLVSGGFTTWGGTNDGNGGGEFLIQELLPGGGIGEIFKTFCLEKNEFISLPGTYYVTLDDGAIQGGNGGGNPDVLSEATKWLYYWYITGALDDIDFTSASDFSYDDEYEASELQQAFWYLEDEVDTVNGLGMRLVNYANQYVTNNGAFNVANAEVTVLNLWTAPYPVQDPTAQRKQSQLYFRTTEGGTGGQIPEPASIAIWSVISLVGVTVFRRHSRRKV